MRYNIYEYLFAENSIEKQFEIEVYSNGNYELTITNDEIYQEKIEISRSLCSESQIVFGSCETATMKFTVRNTVGTLINKHLKVYLNMGLITHYIVGEFDVISDILSGNRVSRNIVAKDKIYKVINSDVSEWYSQRSFPLTLKNFRDQFFAHFGITQATINLPNDDFVVMETVLSDILTGKDVLSAICSANGCFGLIDSEGLFQYIFIDNPAIKSYGKNYHIDSLEYEDYKVQSITGLKVYTNNSTITVGTDTNEYMMLDNFLFYDRLETDLQPYIENIFDVIKDTVRFVPLKVETFGDFCVEVGDRISFTNSQNEIITTLVFNKTIKGVQSLTDTFNTECSEYLQYDLNSTNSQIARLWNNTIVLQNNINNAKSVVYAYRNRTAYTGLNAITDYEKIIISMQLSATEDSIPVFVATIPLTMSLDGEVTFRYYIDGVQIENDADTIYFTKGEQFATVSTYFQMSSGTTVTFTVTAEANYRQSVERQHTAKILSLKDWIDNQSITVDVQNETATFNYAYVDQPIDETPPIASIPAFAIRAVIFASGLVQNEQGGDITVADIESAWNIGSLDFINITDTVSSDLHTPTPITLSDSTSVWVIGNPAFVNVNDSVTATLRIDSYTRITEDGTVRVTEDNDTRITEGD